ncbi:MAG: tetratricopeptide repeat protein [Chitinophagaceae bacterium]
MNKFKFAVILLLSVICGCSGFKHSAAKDKAENYYQKALSILQATTHNALSKSLSNQALHYIDTAISLYPFESKYYRVRGTSYYHLKEYDLAISNFTQALKLDSTNSLAWMNRAITFENTEKYSLAEQDYLKALQYDRKSATIYFNMGLLYDKWGKDNLSLLAYDQAIKIDPKNESAYLNRGEANLENGSYLNAISDFNIILSLDSAHKLAYNNRGLCKYYLNQYEDAIIDFKKALSLKLDDSFYENFDTDKYSYNNIANSYFGLGNIKEACIYWNMAIQKGYKYKKEWKAVFHIDDPNELLAKYCK